MLEALKKAQQKGFNWYKDNGITEKLDSLINDYEHSNITGKNYTLREDDNPEINRIYEVKNGYIQQCRASVYKKHPSKYGE